MLEALWSVEFFSNLQMFGSGIVIFETNRIFGGDAAFYYVGDYKLNNDNIEGTVTIVNYSGNNQSIVGIGKEFKIKLTGKIHPSQMELTGYRVDASNIKILVKLTKRAELP